MNRVRSYLASYTRSERGPLELARSEALCAEAWRTLGILLVRADDPNLTWPERELVNALGIKKFGRRN